MMQPRFPARSDGGEKSNDAERTPAALDLALIIGCARSGTSILGELIASHPEIHYHFEAHPVWELAGRGENDSHRLTEEHATDKVVQQIRRWLERHSRPGTILMEKNPRNVLRVPFLGAVVPEASLIHIIRDGRDVACSMLPGIGGASWQHLKPPLWRRLRAENEGVVRCALAWKEIMEIAVEDLAGVPHLLVRYEDLVRRPQEMAGRIFSFLGLHLHQDCLAFCDRISASTESAYHAKGQERWYRNDHTSRLDRWRETLDEDEQQRLTDALAPLLERLGYRVEAG